MIPYPDSDAGLQERNKYQKENTKNWFSGKEPNDVE